MTLPVSVHYSVSKGETARQAGVPGLVGDHYSVSKGETAGLGTR